MIINTERLRKKLQEEIDDPDFLYNRENRLSDLWRLERIEELYKKYFQEVKR
ncbi:MAG: hypothetical protein ACFFC1_05610 [Promethearchaeota archaeon]